MTPRAFRAAAFRRHPEHDHRLATIARMTAEGATRTQIGSVLKISRARVGQLVEEMRYAPRPWIAAPRRMSKTDAIELYRREKAAAEPRRRAAIENAKAAYVRLLADLADGKKGGRPRKPVAAVSEGRRRG